MVFLNTLSCSPYKNIFSETRHFFVETPIMTRYNKSIQKTLAPVAQLDRAFASGAKGQRFKSSRVHHFRLNV